MHKTLCKLVKFSDEFGCFTTQLMSLDAAMELETNLDGGH